MNMNSRSMKSRFVCIAHDDQWYPEFVGDLPLEGTVIDLETNCPVTLLNGLIGECIPFKMAEQLTLVLNFLEEERIQREKEND